MEDLETTLNDLTALSNSDSYTPSYETDAEIEDWPQKTERLHHVKAISLTLQVVKPKKLSKLMQKLKDLVEEGKIKIDISESFN